MTIYDIKNRVVNAPHFFDRKSMEFFGQTMKMFRVRKMGEVYRISSPMYMGRGGRLVGETVRIFDPRTNELKMEGEK